MNRKSAAKPKGLPDSDAVKISPQVIQALDRSESAQEDLAVVYRVKGEAGATAPPPEDMTSLTQNILARAAKAAVCKPLRFNTFRNLGSFVVLGRPSLHREILNQPEVVGAVLNQGGPSSAK